MTDRFAEALIAAGPTSEYPVRMREFARLVGRWDARGSRLDEGTGEWRERAFEWVVEYVLEGRAVQDLEITTDDARRSIATAVRVYDPEAGAWRVSFFSPETGEYCTLVATSYRDGIRQDGTRTDGLPIRWNFSGITDDAYIWDGWVSTDDGRTWVHTDHVEATRMR